MQLIDASQKILDLIASRRNELAAALGEGADAVVHSRGSSASIERSSTGSSRRSTRPSRSWQAPGGSGQTLAWIGPGSTAKPGREPGPWLDIFIRSIGASPDAVFCDLFEPDNVSGGATDMRRAALVAVVLGLVTLAGVLAAGRGATG